MVIPISEGNLRIESDEQTGFQEKVMIERKDKTLNPTVNILNKKGEAERNYSIPVKAHLTVNEGDKIKAGKILLRFQELPLL